MRAGRFGGRARRLERTGAHAARRITLRSLREGRAAGEASGDRAELNQPNLSFLPLAPDASGRAGRVCGLAEAARAHAARRSVLAPPTEHADLASGGQGDLIGPPGRV